MLPFTDLVPRGKNFQFLFLKPLFTPYSNAASCRKNVLIGSLRDTKRSNSPRADNKKQDRPQITEKHILVFLIEIHVSLRQLLFFLSCKPRILASALQATWWSLLWMRCGPPSNLYGCKVYLSASHNLLGFSKSTEILTSLHLLDTWPMEVFKDLSDNTMEYNRKHSRMFLLFPT